MNKLFSVLFLLLISFSTIAQDSIIDLLPDPFTLPGLQLAGDPEIYTGEDLFDLINGGAEIYIEYGFEKVVSQNYSDISGSSSLRVEIYQMTDPEAAFGIFAFTATGQKVIDKTTHYVVKGEGYGMMVRGAYFVIATYASLSNDLQNSMLKLIAQNINTKVKTYAELPRLYISTQPPCRDFTQALYFRGPLALRNITYLDFKLPFEIKEGVAYRCDVYDYIFILPDSEKTKKELVQETISNILKKNPDFTTSAEAFGFSIKQNDHLKYEILPDNNSIVLIKYF